MHEGKIQPNVAASAPKKPASRMPTNVAELTAIGPRHLGNCNQVGKFRSRQPPMLRHYLLLNQRKRCIAAAEAEHADLQKAQKKAASKSSLFLLSLPDQGPYHSEHDTEDHDIDHVDIKNADRKERCRHNCEG